MVSLFATTGARGGGCSPNEFLQPGLTRSGGSVELIRGPTEKDERHSVTGRLENGPERIIKGQTGDLLVHHRHELIAHGYGARGGGQASFFERVHENTTVRGVVFFKDNAHRFRECHRHVLCGVHRVDKA